MSALVAALRAIPVWMVRDMRPGWQEHGTAAYMAADLLNGKGPYGSRKEVDCPRCHEQYGWCSDPRWLHGRLKLPGSRRKCSVPGYEPEGDGCVLCGGKRRVIRVTAYEPLQESDPE